MKLETDLKRRFLKVTNGKITVTRLLAMETFTEQHSCDMTETDVVTVTEKDVVTVIEKLTGQSVMVVHWKHTLSHLHLCDPV